MRISTITIHNFRSIEQQTYHLGNYSLLVGANNSGKSNTMAALRAFYEKDRKFDNEIDLPKFSTSDQESWIDIEFILNDIEFSNVKDEYKRPNNRIKVRKYFVPNEKEKGKPKQGIYAYIGESVSNEHFYGAKNVQQGKLGDIIFVPAVSRLEEHLKLSGPSVLRELLTEMIKKLASSSEAFRTLKEDFDVFEEKFREEETADKRSIVQLEEDISKGIDEWGVSFKIGINPIAESELIKNLIEFKILDKNLNQELAPDQFGQGLQRYMIFTVIQLAAAYQTVAPPQDQKEFTPKMTLLLFEEPEAFLHPMQQNVLCQSLRTIASQEGQQVLISTHSPNFVSQNCTDLPSLIHLKQANSKTHVGQVTNAELTKIFADNQEINDILKGTKDEPEIEDLTEDMEAVKYFLWLNPERCGMFFAGKVLIVEGTSERVLINYLIDSGKIKSPPGGIFVLDSLGKWNIHRFMNLLGPLGIPHCVVFDADGGKPPHEKIKELIENSRNSCTENIESLPHNLEAFLGIPNSKPHRKPQSVMLKYKSNGIKEARINEYIKLVESLIHSNSQVVQ